MVIEEMRARAEALGRTLRFGWRSHVIVRETESEARDAARQLLSRLDPDHRSTRSGTVRWTPCRPGWPARPNCGPRQTGTGTSNATVDRGRAGPQRRRRGHRRRSRPGPGHVGASCATPAWTRSSCRATPTCPSATCSPATCWPGWSTGHWRCRPSRSRSLETGAVTCSGAPEDAADGYPPPRPWLSRPTRDGCAPGPTASKASGSSGVTNGMTRRPRSTKNPTDFLGRRGSRLAQCRRSPEPQIRPFPAARSWRTDRASGWTRTGSVWSPMGSSSRGSDLGCRCTRCARPGRWTSGIFDHRYRLACRTDERR